MFLTLSTVVFLLVGAIALALMDKLLSPGISRWPCAHPVIRWSLRLYALAIFNRGAHIIGLLWQNGRCEVQLDVFLGSMAMCVTHLLLFAALVAASPNRKTWRRFERRYLGVEVVRK